MKNYRLKENALEADRKALNKLAREQLKLKLLNDIRLDIEVCKIEGWDYKVYLMELKEIIDSFTRK